jgi:glucosamine kinase
MIAIVESGTTKTSWLFVKSVNETFIHKTIGMNPYYQTSDDIKKTLHETLLPELKSEELPSKIYFYGAGCELQEQREVVKKGIVAIFPTADVYVTHDLLASARALFGNEKGIACIAGTGSNSGLYDGEAITANIHSLGLFMGDEGSGGYKGKLLLRDYIRNAMPIHLKEKFEEKYCDRTKEIMDAVYLKPFPSRYLASYVPFLTENIHDAYVKNLVFQSFEAQFDQTICRYKDFQNYPIGFVGSVAHYLKDVLLEVAASKNAKITNIIQAPLDALVQYHLKQGLN